MVKLTGIKKDCLYWDKSNELVERLRLILISPAAGHIEHVNEINYIIQELLKANITLLSVKWSNQIHITCKEASCW